MKTEELFTVIKSRWPSQIDISDAKVLSGKGFLCRELVRIEENVEATLPAITGLIAAAIWPFHQALCKRARANFLAGTKVVNTDEVSITTFASYLEEALSNPSWSIEKREYDLSNSGY